MLYRLTAGPLAAFDPAAIWATAKPIILLALGFSLVIFVHELGHFLAAKWAKVKVEQFAIGFGQAVLSFRKGLGVRFGSSADEFQKRIEEHLIAGGQLVPGEHPDDDPVRRPTERERTAAARALGLSETEYRINWMPLGGYVKMLGQEDFVVDKSGELKVRDNEDSFTNKSVGARMVIVSAGVIMNLIFAAVVFTIVMMVGVKVMPNVIGAVVPDSPAGRAGLQAGDKIVSINGDPITSYKDIQTSVVLSDSGEELVFEVERDGKRVEPSPRILPEFNKNEKVRQIGVTNGMSRRVLLPDIRMAESQADDELHPRDELYQLVLPGGERKEFKDLGVFIRAMQAARGKDIQVVVRRPKKPDDMTEEQLLGDQPVDATETLVNMRAMWVCSPETPSDPATLSLLGLVPRVTLLMPTKSMLEGGVENGDILRKINDIDHPTLAQTRDAVTASPNQKMTLEVCRPLAKNNGLSDRAVRFCVARRDAWIARAGKELDAARALITTQANEDKSLTDADRKALAEALARHETFPEFRLWLDKIDVHVLSNVTPKPPFGLLSWLGLTAKEKPTLDVQMVPLDDEQIVVATVLDTVDGRTSPARAAGIPAGAILTAVDGQPVRHWSELTEALRERCGRTVTIAYRVDSTPGEAKLAVPMEVSAALQLGAGTRILSIDGRKTATLPVVGDAKPAEVALPDWRAVREILKSCAGRTVKVEYVSAEGVKGSGDYAATQDTADPWLLRVDYLAFHALRCVPLQTTLSESSPLAAAAAGFKRAYASTVETIQSLRHVVITREVGTEKLSGPVGIFRYGSAVADKGMVELLWFLGIISANLAVINFLPMPIVDGGLFLFLVLEKLRGEPVSIKTQVVTQLVGIALIATLFVLVTYQDILNWITGA